MDREKILRECREVMMALNIGEHRFGIVSVNNGRIIERLAAGGSLLVETLEKLNAFIGTNLTKE